MPFLKKIKNLITLDGDGNLGDRQLITILFIILVFGLISLSSASAIVAYAKFNDAYYYFKHQLFGLGVGLIAFWYFSRVDYRVWRKYAFVFLVCSVVLLLLVFIPGLSTTYGKARSWINVFGYSVQPSELVKLSFLLYLAAWLEARKTKLHDWHQGIGPFIAILGIVGGLMVLQPDLGTLAIITLVSLIVYFVAGGKKSHIVFIIAAGILCIGVLALIKPYQMNRFKCLMNPDFSRNEICYQTNQSLIAVGSGGILGRGIGQSRQKYMYLPEVSGDSIFAIIAEETGFIVCVLLLACYFYLFYRSFAIAKNAPDDFGRILAIGIGSWIMVQAIINIGGIINLMPMTGVPLPLISYGGTAILAALSACGVLVNISKQGRIPNK
jgi:cell division protein FtsW